MPRPLRPSKALFHHLPLRPFPRLSTNTTTTWHTPTHILHFDPHPSFPAIQNDLLAASPSTPVHLQSFQRATQVFSESGGVRRIFRYGFPAFGGGAGRRDEEVFLGVRGGEVERGLVRVEGGEGEGMETECQSGRWSVSVMIISENEE